MENLKSLVLSMLNMPFRYQQAYEREKSYYEQKAQEANLTLEQYFKELENQKINEIIQECLFG